MTVSVHPGLLIHEALSRFAAREAPAEGLGRPALSVNASAVAGAMSRIGTKRIAAFEAWLAAVLDNEAGTSSSPEAVHGLIGLGPGLTPSGDDFLAGALAMLDALGHRRACAALASAIDCAPPGLTSPLSGHMLRCAAAGHVGEALRQAVAAVLAGDAGMAIAVVRKVGHSSGWDMLAGITAALRVASGSPAAASPLASGGNRN